MAISFPPGHHYGTYYALIVAGRQKFSPANEIGQAPSMGAPYTAQTVTLLRWNASRHRTGRHRTSGAFLDNSERAGGMAVKGLFWHEAD